MDVALHNITLSRGLPLLTDVSSVPSILAHELGKLAQSCLVEQILTALEGPAKLTSLVDAALSAKKFSEAHLLLRTMSNAGIPVDLAARWQWVRDLNLMTGFSRQTTGFDRRTERDRALLPLLITLLSIAGPKDCLTETKASSESPILPASVWDFRKSKVDPSTIFTPDWDETTQHALRAKFRIIPDSSSGNQPSAHGRALPYFASDNDAIPLTTGTEVTHHVHSAVPNLHFLEDVLSKEECRSIIDAAETVGFIKLGSQSCAPGGLSWHWVVDEAFRSKLWSRVEKSVPFTFRGKAVRGLNRWFRVHRHVPGQEFPAHFGRFASQVSIEWMSVLI